MRYKNGNSVLPNDLLKAVQTYIDGEYIYIPRKVENKKRWGEVKNSKHYILERNEKIYFLYQSGVSVKDIAKNYYLSPKTIYKILANMKHQY